ncbi:hypothetical protein [Catellatospora sp. NPDC049609]|uniref:hypothetical protein n=1 Tax=Catellatospora sp. NPDC049609 TaxID=3155505 RepID=UPI003429CBC3
MQPDKGRDWTVPVIVGAVLLVLVLVLCVAGGAAAYLLARRGDPAPVAAASPSRSPSPAAAAPSPSPASPARCLVGRWKETSYTGNADIYGANVQLTGSGALFDFRADGTLVAVHKTTRRGTSSGDRYEVIHNGTITISYEADDKMIHYSNVRATGTTTWKVNGSTRGRQNLSSTLDPERYTCKGDKLRLYGENFAVEADRILPPGRPV